MTFHDLLWNPMKSAKTVQGCPRCLLKSLIIYIVTYIYIIIYIYYITLIYNYIFMLLAEIIYTQLLLKDFLRFDMFHGGCWEMHRCLAVKSTMFAPRIHLPCMYNFKIIPILFTTVNLSWNFTNVSHPVLGRGMWDLRSGTGPPTGWVSLRVKDSWEP